CRPLCHRAIKGRSVKATLADRCARADDGGRTRRHPHAGGDRGEASARSWSAKTGNCTAEEGGQEIQAHPLSDSRIVTRPISQLRAAKPSPCFSSTVYELGLNQNASSFACLVDSTSQLSDGSWVRRYGAAPTFIASAA